MEAESEAERGTEKEMKLSRRELFRDVGKFVGGAAVGAGITKLSSGSVPARAEEVPEWPWPYEKLDPQAVAERGYKAYFNLHCCAGSFEAIVGELREQVGYPYTLIPSKMMVYGAGGQAGWGTICGALNGSNAAINLATKDYMALSSELIGWYTETAIPAYKPRAPKNAKIETTSVSGSPLCHVSVTKWCDASGFGSTSPERAERCARLVAQVSAHAAELLNQHAAGKFKATWAAPAVVGDCLKCHGPDGSQANTFGKMDCLDCHDQH